MADEPKINDRRSASDGKKKNPEADVRQDGSVRRFGGGARRESEFLSAENLERPMNRRDLINYLSMIEYSRSQWRWHHRLSRWLRGRVWMDGRFPFIHSESYPGPKNQIGGLVLAYQRSIDQSAERLQAALEAADRAAMTGGNPVPDLTIVKEEK